MGIRERNNIRVRGNGPATLVFSHGFGCDQNMWRLLEAEYSKRYRTILFDLVGSGQSDLSAYDPDKYSVLDGYASDVCEIMEEFGDGPAVFLGHSVSAMIGLLSELAAPGAFAAQVMIGPSPCYINRGDYIGGFEQEDIVSLLETLESNYLGWSSSMAPAIMGSPQQPELSVELTNSFCRTDPDIAKHFARVAFMSDNREDVFQLETPTLVIQCTEDIIAPFPVGEFMVQSLLDGTLAVVDNVGHCPHLSAPWACRDAIDEFLATNGF